MPSYRYATVVQLLEDDPANPNMTEGTIRLVAGKHEDGYSYTVVNAATEGFHDVKCETIGVIGPSDYPMEKRAVTSWAADTTRAKELAKMASEEGVEA